MAETLGRILKSDDVELEGQYFLDMAPESAAGEPQLTSAPVAAIQAHILENHPEYAVIEITCSCGRKVCLKCKYTGVQSPENP
ncbi:MAG: hypothetical protein CEE38_16900 [Planctomycetes bacterium B3_Pla]|nr:MAG: hypothetical protein CEE38_16900 [Planctomycetes bacterium B3_Pla]